MIQSYDEDRTRSSYDNKKKKKKKKTYNGAVTIN